MNSPYFYLTLLLIALVMQGFFTMLEMALVTFNKLRVQYFVQRGEKKAHWIYYLKNHPIKLFGTTLIGMHFAMQFGSECARRLYESIGINPNLSPILQTIIVLIFAELAPMFAAARSAEQVSLSGIPIDSYNLLAHSDPNKNYSYSYLYFSLLVFLFEKR